ncbi:MAG: DJ-1/PfpI family protein [Candidatus Omnitrophica bacterium]|nr:DJ-1/PfpI family protein [Candidatus Omnitrophota bacterium]
MSKRVLVPIADGTEEIEAVTVIDVLRRAGAEVLVASVTDEEVVASRGVRLIADDLIENCVDEEYDLIVLPGGMPGADFLAECDELIELLHRHRDAGKIYAAICAAPAIVLEHHGLLENCRATAHPNYSSKLGNQEAVDCRVVIDGNCVTSRGPGTAMEFALTLVELLYGPEKRAQVAGPMLAS